MKVIVKETTEEMSREALSIFKANFQDSATLGFATGSTSLGLYSLISKQCKSGSMSFKGKKTFNLDEYYPISPSNKESYRYFMDYNLFNNTDVPKSAINFPNSELTEAAAILTYKKMYDANGPVDFQILGIGVNGHIGFNEPGSEIDCEIRIVDLEKETITRNKTKFSRAITMGVKEILESRAILLMASGMEKSGAIKAAVEGEMGKNVPASFLQAHNNVVFVLDEAAASKLS